MRSMTLAWKKVVANGEFNMESKVRIYGATGSDPNGTAGSDSRGSYKEYATITAPIITRALLSGDSISVGNTISSQLNFTLMTTDTIPKSAMILVLGRAYDDQYSGGWFYFGTYWIDHRTVNDDLIDIEAYDAMKKGNQVYSDNSSTMSWPKTIQTVVVRIVQQMGVSIDSTVTALFSQVGNLNIITKPNDDMTLLDILKYLGEVIGGNWIITDDNKLRFVALASPPEETNYIIDEAHNFITTEQGDYLIHTGESQAHEGQTHPVSGFGTSYVPVVLGSITTASKYTISKVTIALDSDHVYTYGDDTGYHLIASESNPYASDAMAQLLYSRVNGVTYAPFEITNAVYDPATELGDWVVAGSVYGVLYNEKRVLDVGFYGNMSAPGRDEMEDEYPYVSALARMKYETNEKIKDLDSRTTTHFSTIEQSLLGITSRVGTVENTTSGLTTRVSTVEQTASSIQLSVEEIEDDYVSKTNDSIRSLFAMDSTSITLSSGTITFNAGTLIVNSTNFKLDEDGYLECYGAKIGSTGYNSYTAKNNTITIENGYISGYASNLNDKCLIEFDSIGTTSGQSYSFMKLNAPYIDMSANVGYAYVYGKDQANISAGSRNSSGRTPCEIDLDLGGVITIRGYSVYINDNSSQYTGFNGYIYMLTNLNGGWAQYKVVNGFIVQ